MFTIESSGTGPASEAPDRNQRQFAIYCHLAAFAGLVVPFGNVVGPLIFWPVKRDTMPFVIRSRVIPADDHQWPAVDSTDEETTP